MIKTGITKLNQLSNDKTFCRKELKNVSVTLYDQTLNLVDGDQLAERILLLFSDERGAYKRTYQKRFEAFDLAVIKMLQKLPPPPQTFHDCGVSDGRTSLDFFEKMVAIFPEIHYFASDYNPCVFVIEKGKLKVTLSHTGKILEILFPPFVFNKIKRDSFRHYPLNHLILFFIEKFWVNFLIKKYQQGLVKAKELLLFAPKVLQKAQTDKRFRLGQHDLLQPFKEPACIIRAMNVLNPSYFCETEFAQVIRNLYEGLRENGLLITGSNQEAGTIVNGGIYQKKEMVFRKFSTPVRGHPSSHFFLILKLKVFLCIQPLSYHLLTLAGRSGFYRSLPIIGCQRDIK